MKSVVIEPRGRNLSFFEKITQGLWRLTQVVLLTLYAGLDELMQVLRRY